MIQDALDFELPVAQLEAKLASIAQPKGGDCDQALELQAAIKATLTDIFSQLEPWQKLALARHPKRPHSIDYINACFEDFDLLAGDRMAHECEAIVGGIATLKGRSVMVIGQQKGRNLEDNLRVNFAMPKPAGYRKVKRLMLLAERYQMPVITLLDSPGADAHVDAELANQSEAIASNMVVMSELKTPIISVVIGEAMSGGAMAMGVADRIAMLEYSVFSVISPEGCAAILWRDAVHAKQAANAMGITADKLADLKLIDEVIKEPLGGAHRDYDLCFKRVKKFLVSTINGLDALDMDDLLSKRYRKWMLPSLEC